ncbi:hypothetical protein B0H16DRAFT_1722400 [Mycena metata]|uniref:Uncharacterized protein n=1 Tax=Mycena metata TaxID=1033252 RepID=A0AAD7ND28_9AGAR|nr:hypothetical protein B0H16DRAFT_1722400 [Mycena metata]
MKFSSWDGIDLTMCTNLPSQTVNGKPTTPEKTDCMQSTCSSSSKWVPAAPKKKTQAQTQTQQGQGGQGQGQGQGQGN